MRLDRTDLINMMSSHLGDPSLCEWHVPPRVRLQAVDSVVLLQQDGQVTVEHGLAVAVMNQEQRRFLTPFSD